MSWHRRENVLIPPGLREIHVGIYFKSLLLDRDKDEIPGIDAMCWVIDGVRMQ